ncbi:hypothetical protein [Oscillatoria sp. FACHB-1406]|uniref:hypothetical protein n=1 Tax=Oscillatoria sp. FACHB-1406 TaxID=2692846 RepID=UPI0016827840|nr:hypothetical protein [Oscillatoria sp. FACHB-1406]MBD2576763.1 hypothetical protein [Oscillatoria sp. FACHB-1406]
MQIILSQEQTHILQSLVERGEYPSLEDALDMALFLLVETASSSKQNQISEYNAWIEETRQKIETARSQANSGEVLELEAVLTQLRAKVKSAKETA